MLSVQSDATSTTLTIMALDGKGQPLTSKKAVKVKVEGHRGKVVAATASCGSGRGGRNPPYDRLMLHFQVWSLTHSLRVFGQIINLFRFLLLFIFDKNDHYDWG